MTVHEMTVEEMMTRQDDNLLEQLMGAEARKIGQLQPIHLTEAQTAYYNAVSEAAHKVMDDINTLKNILRRGAK